MSLPPPKQTPTNNVQSAPAVLINHKTTGHTKPTPDMLPSQIRERFEYTPGLYAFLNRVLNLSVISKQSPENLAEQFFNNYDNLVQKGDKYPALRSYRMIAFS